MAIIDRVKYDGPAGVLVWRAPGDNFTWGTQVIVNQSQEAIFYKGGQALDVLGPGTHTLKTANIPLLRGLISAPFGGETPFAAEIYYINKASLLDVKWGTTSPIPIQDPKFNVFLPVRAFGQFGVQVADSRQFVVQIVGTLFEFTTDTLNNYFRGMLLTRVKDYIASTIIKQKINVLEISAHLEEMSTEIGKHLEAEFAKFGIKLVNFYLNSVDVPDDDTTVVRLKKILADKAELDILGTGYNTKRTFDTLEKAAGNEGGAAGAGLGLGMGFGAGSSVGNMMAGVFGQQAAQPHAAPPAAPVAAAAVCASCHAENAPGSRFCGECGKALGPAKCPKCQAEVPAGAKFCSNCGEKIG
jgi:membrane protease subunit (stomatin/prohibitin family)